ncbi:DUF2846 domain-containing protein [Myxococcota bacterium]|nr:DUF2846 domain-containing protein [Myxococcota bacterium]
MVRAPTLLLLALALTPAAAHAEATLTVRTRVPALAYVVMPKQGPARFPISTLFRALSKTIEAETALEVRPIDRVGLDPAELDACPADTRLGCWSRLADLADPRRDGAVREGGARDPRWLFVLAARKLDDARDSISLVLLDLDEAAALRANGADDETIEAALFERSPRAEAATIGAGDEAAFARELSTALDGALGGALERRGSKTKLGEIVLHHGRAGDAVALDGAPIGLTGAGTTYVRGVPPGTHRLVITTGAESQELVVDVVAGTPVEARSLFEPTPSSTFRTSVLWTGVGVAAAGAAITVLGIVRASDDVRGACLVRPGDVAECPAIGAPTFGYDPSRAPSTDPSAVNPSGVPITPLGLALVAGGATWSLGALFDDAERPWLVLGLGIAAAAATFATGVVLDPR